ncbi:MAG: type II secretion system protein GspL [Candidatus Thiodiazotropha sp.]
MAELLILHCHTPSCDQVTWLIKGPGVAETFEGTLTEAAQEAKGRRVLVLIPSTEVLITEVKIPTRNRQRLLQAIPFSLENELTEDIDQLHFAAGSIDSDNVTPVIIIARQKLESWLEKLDSAGIETLAIYPDLLCLPLSNDSWSLYHDNHVLQLHSQAHKGFSVDSVNGADFLKLALQQAEEHTPKTLTLYQLKDTASDLDLNTIAPNCEITNVALDSLAQLTALLGNNINEKQQINLLQNEYQRVDKMTLQWKRWLPAAVLGLLFAGLSMILTVQDYFHYEQQSAELNTQIRKTFQQAFPKIKRIVDPKQQMEQQLKALQVGQSGGFAQFTSLFVPTARIIKKSPNTELQNISFRDGQLNLQLTIKELQALEALKKSIEREKLKVEIRSANASGKQVTSQIRISGGQ